MISLRRSLSSFLHGSAEQQSRIPQDQRIFIRRVEAIERELLRDLGPVHERELSVRNCIEELIDNLAALRYASANAVEDDPRNARNVARGEVLYAISSLQHALSQLEGALKNGEKSS
jgi:hypothetical protein